MHKFKHNILSRFVAEQIKYMLLFEDILGL